MQKLVNLTSGAIQFMEPTMVLVLVLASPMTVATPKSPMQISIVDFMNMLLAFRSLCMTP